MRHRFIDETPLHVKAGNGGAGCISFRHEKYREFGGPDGGDGGKGGNVYILPSQSVNTLNHIRSNKIYRTQNGQPGLGRQKSGKDGRDIHIKVPLGTQILDADTNEVIHDLLTEEPYLLAEGARGGRGNTFFKSSTHQSPRFAQPGEETVESHYILSLKLIADAGLVGLPNAGKSTLLKALTEANPKTSDYPFTTLEPNLGVLNVSFARQIIIADIPGIIEGASKGHGLGLSFLKHIERVKVIIYVLDINAADVEAELNLLKHELSQYNPRLLERPSIVVFNKIDKMDDEGFTSDWISSYQKGSSLMDGSEVVGISALKNMGIKNLVDKLEAITSL